MGGFALILGAEGSRGAYEWGVAAAFRELELKLNRVAGASLGALGAALIAQGDRARAQAFWEGPGYQAVLALHDTMTRRYVDKWSQGSFDYFRLSFLADLFRGGVDTQEVTEHLAAVLDEETLRSSETGLTLLSVSPATLRPVVLELAEIPPGKLLEQLLLCIAIPVFRRAEGSSRAYIDTAFSPRAVAEALLKQGERHLVVAGEAEAQIRRPLRKAGGSLLEINNNAYQGDDNDATAPAFAEAERIGSRDTLKALGVLEGAVYFLDLGGKRRLFKQVASALGALPVDGLVRHKLTALLGLPPDANRQALRVAALELIQSLPRYRSEELALGLLENGAELLGLDPEPVYAPDELLLTMVKRLNALILENRGFLGDKKNLARYFSPQPLDRALHTPADFTQAYLIFSGLSTGINSASFENLRQKLPPHFILGLFFFTYVQLITTRRNP